MKYSLHLAAELPMEDMQHIVDVLNDIDKGYLLASIDNINPKVICLQADSRFDIDQAISVGYLIGGLHSCAVFNVPTDGIIGLPAKPIEN